MAEMVIQTKDETKDVAHGGDLDHARARFPDAPEPWLDLSTGISPWPYPLPVIAPEAWSRLPLASEEERLRAVAATAYGALSAAHVALAPGSQALIQLLPRLRERGRVAVLGPTYAEHARAWAEAGHQVSVVEEFGAMAREGEGKGEVLVVVNPNNPDGRALAPDTLFALADAQRARGGWLVVDEAFADVAPEISVAAGVARPGLPAGLLVVRSFGKFFGLAGLRLGVLLADVDLIESARRALGPWAVGGPALAVATVALGDHAWIAATRQRLAGERRRLDALLAAHGLNVIGGTDLFRLASGARAAAIFAALAGDGILVRRFVDRPDWLRFGIPGDEGGWRRLERSLTVA